MRLFLVLALSLGGCVLDLSDDDDAPAPGSGRFCGGFAGVVCDDDEFCDYPEENQCGIADGSGTCEARPRACADIYLPVQGSDGRVYGNACEAHAAGADDCGPAPRE